MILLKVREGRTPFTRDGAAVHWFRYDPESQLGQYLNENKNILVQGKWFDRRGEFDDWLRGASDHWEVYVEPYLKVDEDL